MRSSSNVQSEYLDLDDLILFLGGIFMISFLFSNSHSFVPWDPVSMAVGDLPVFSQLLGDGKNPLRIPTILIGLDILSQRQITLETGMGKSRRIFVSPS